ncbi:phospholipid carrier-dependent glycosyltransferase [Spelaeicoccus albus]|nr:phospholipid carrier-dependent glycosyltransferase [Spelaeicoccus albus]
MPPGRRPALAERALSAAELKILLLGTRAGRTIIGWAVPIVIAALGGALRFYRLGRPHALVFDETYYVKDAYSYLHGGYERNWPDKANELFTSGHQNILLHTPEFSVHPPVGKWMIAAGMKLFGTDSSFGWRFAAAVVGTLSILMVARIARRLFGSNLLGATAGLLLAVDGEHFVHSRTSLLDIFVMFWALATFAAVLLDRDYSRKKLADRTAAPHPAMRRPRLGFRPWLVTAGICAGLTMGTKWSGVYFLAAFGLLAVFWNVGARRTVGERHYLKSGLLGDGIPAFFQMVPIAFATYVASWIGWIRASNSYDRQWAADHTASAWSWLPDWLRSLAEYHAQMYHFNITLHAGHPYMSNPWGWLVQWRPTSFYYEQYHQGQHGCSAHTCSAAITSLGNPLLWWLGVIALLVCVAAWALRRDTRAGAVLAGIAGGYLPWFQYEDRTIFTFYTIAFTPFVVLAVTYLIGILVGPAAARRRRRLIGTLVAGVLVAAIVVVFAFYWPIYSAEVIPYKDWQLRMWTPTWI